MTNKRIPPYVSQDVEEVSSLIRNLENHRRKDFRSSKKSISCKKTSFEVSGSTNSLIVDSWRFQDWDYKRDDLPTYARGLFTTRNKKGQPEIAIRGYDKFFNIDEVRETKWDIIESDTKGPYELSLKENGCIIFISGLWDDSLLVCSKHSTGDRGDGEVSHAIAGEQWVDKQLVKIGKTRQELAQELRKRNITAVAELCDDDFEEHILAYKNEEAGLYLHGLNLNIPEFATYPGSEVQDFADQWGFKRTEFLVLDDISAVRTFLESVAETGSYNGRDVEGFVIRCRATFASGPFHDWFFKYKFEEPYLMYRQWRECTKALINQRSPMFKKHVKITEEYLLYARTRFAKEPHLAKEYNQNHGIIELRNDFLTFKNVKGSDIIRMEFEAMGHDAARNINKDVILVPIATIGCGKTTIAVALQHLFGWGHVQNDNITGKGRPPRFTNEVLSELENVPVVIADRNNAQRHERRQILEDVHRRNPAIRLVALNFQHTPESVAKIRAVTRERVLSRGDNHQTIQAATDQDKVIGIMEGFIRRFETLQPYTKPDNGFDSVIVLDPTAESRQNLETIVSRLHSLYPELITEVPSTNDLDEAIDVALREYNPQLRHDVSIRGPRANQHEHKPKASTQVKKRNLEYISVSLPTNDIMEALEKTFSSQDPETTKFFRQLQQTRRVQPKFHVTLIHRASASEDPQLWERYKNLHESAGGAENKMGSCKIQLERVVWNNKIMAIVVRILDADWECVNAVPHVTVGTRGEDVKPRESNDLLQVWLKEGSSNETGIGELVIKGSLTIDGIVHGVLSR